MSPHPVTAYGDIRGLPLQHLAPVVACTFPGAAARNAPLVAAFAALTPADFERRSHFISGRFEDFYLAPERLPGLTGLLTFATAAARSVLRLDTFWRGPAAEAALRCGFWLDTMDPGQHTSRHSHSHSHSNAKNDALLSAVYYVTTPPGCGDLLFHDDPFEVRVRPVPGMLLCFPPDLPHSVEPNTSSERRLSIAFNFGPVFAHGMAGPL